MYEPLCLCLNHFDRSHCCRNWWYDVVCRGLFGAFVRQTLIAPPPCCHLSRWFIHMQSGSYIGWALVLYNVHFTIYSWPLTYLLASYKQWRKYIRNEKKTGCMFRNPSQCSALFYCQTKRYLTENNRAPHQNEPAEARSVRQVCLLEQSPWFRCHELRTCANYECGANRWMAAQSQSTVQYRTVDIWFSWAIS